jgi:tetratricopeptide (TPR) repeat protein
MIPLVKAQTCLLAPELLAAETCVDVAKNSWVPNHLRQLVLQDQVDTHLSLARDQFGEDKLVEARKNAEAALTLDPTSADAKFRLALISGAEGHYQVSLEALHGLETVRPKDSELQIEIGHVLIDAERIDEAIKVFELALSYDPKNPEGYDGLARAYLRKKNWQAIVENASKAIALEDSSGIYFARRAFAEWSLQQFDKAHSDFEIAHELEPDRTWITEDRAKFLRETTR